MRYFVQKGMKSGNCSALNEFHKSIVDEVFSNFPTELGLKGNVREILDDNFEYESKHRKILKLKIIHKFKTLEVLNKMNKKNMSTRNLGF